MVNPYDEQARLDAMMACAIASVGRHFSHVALADIIKPPHGLFDALLARQIALHILVTEFGIPQRRIAKMWTRQRTSIHFAVRRVDERLDSPVFARAYAAMAGRAKDLFTKQLMEAAA